MYNKVLVPLDGSELAECTLAHVKAVATGCKVPEVILLGVVEPMVHVSRISAELGSNWVAEAQKGIHVATQDYLKKKAAELTKSGLIVSTVVLDGSPADQILDYATKNKVDLIIMSTHGRSGATRWTFGSVADRVSRHSPVAVLLAAPRSCRIA